ncbi:hypothetical protein F0562_023470 [Nyssa sinensis]|uniref:Uncharacterized protein n=1 Tax=Nyssa sinensis TaxID=561372 RepID=A0A5J5BI71_9ASTE|nr:hypothetical protein F0562_023470 [Nyssa sinensis]
MSDAIRYRLKVWQQNDILPTINQPVSSNMLLIQVRIREVLGRLIPSDEDGAIIPVEEESPIALKSFFMDPHLLLSDNTAASKFSLILSDMKVPQWVHPSMIPCISFSVRKIMSEDDNTGLDVVPIVVGIDAVTLQPYDEIEAFTEGVRIMAWIL